MAAAQEREVLHAADASPGRCCGPARRQNSAVRACGNFRIIGLCPAPVQGAADITSLYTAEFGAAPGGKRLFVRASTMVDGFESLPRQFQAPSACCLTVGLAGITGAGGGWKGRSWSAGASECWGVGAEGCAPGCPACAGEMSHHPRRFPVSVWLWPSQGSWWFVCGPLGVIVRYVTRQG